MFLNTSKCKKLFKSAFSAEGLRVARSEGQLYVGGNTWEMLFNWDEIPNKIKAAIIELCGKLPEEGQSFKATKDSAQIEMIETVPDILQKYKLATVNLADTNVLIDHKYYTMRLFQRQDTNDLFSVNTELSDILDFREINFEKEGNPSGPCLYGDEVFYHTCLCTLGVLGIKNKPDTQNGKIMQALSSLTFERKVNA